MSMRQIIAEQYVKLPILIDNKTCSGKTYIVTGSNNGIGLETARHLVASSASRVILAVRNTAAGEKAKADIERTTKSKGVVEVWQLDLASYASVKKFAEKVRNELDRIDGLIENAGVWLNKWTMAEGMETTMMVNVVNTMFLAILVMPKLIESARKYSIQPRLVFLVSGLGFQAVAKKELDKGGRTNILQGVNNSKEQTMDERYGLTKLIEVHAVRALSEMFPLGKTNVVINMVSPGICSTGLARDASVFIRAAQGIIRTVLARTAEQGSRTTLHALFAQEDTHGKHLSGCKVKENWVPSWMTDADGQQMQKQIWKELLALMEKEYPGCTSIPV